MRVVSTTLRWTSAGAGISGFRAGSGLSNYVGALQGHAGGEVPLVLTTQRADWQQRQPCRAGRKRALSSGAEGGGVGREWPSQSDGFAPGSRSRCQRRPGWAA